MQLLSDGWAVHQVHVATGVGEALLFGGEPMRILSTLEGFGQEFAALERVLSVESNWQRN